MVIGRPQSKTSDDQMRTIKLLLLCLSAICIADTSAQDILVPEQKIQWLDIQQNRTNYSVIGDLCPSLLVSNHSPLPFFAFRATSKKGEKHMAPTLSNMSTLEISSSYFDNEQLSLIEDDFRVEVESIQPQHESHLRSMRVVRYRNKMNLFLRLTRSINSARCAFRPSWRLRERQKREWGNY